MKYQALSKVFNFIGLFLTIIFMWSASAVASNVHTLINLSHHKWHSHHNEHCEVSNPKKDCVFKSFTLPIDAFENASQNEIYVFNQHNPNHQASGFAWVSWHGEHGLLPMLNEFSKNAPSNSYKNPFDQQDKTPNVNDWMYSAYVSELENIDLSIKFKLSHHRKEMWIPLWKAQSSINVQQPSGLFGWIKEKACWIGLLECDQRAIYQIGGYAVVEMIDAGFSYQSGKKIPWIKVAFKGFKHCFNRPPTTTSQQFITIEDQGLPIELQASDLDGQALTYTVTQPPSHGVLSGSNGQLVYTPNQNYFGMDSFSYLVSDGIDQTTGQVSIDVNPVNDAPIAAAQQLTTPEDTPIDLTLSAQDVDSTSLTYQISQQPAHGQLSIQGQQVRYTPQANYSGVDKFDFTVSDGLNVHAATITITVSPVNDAPVAQTQQRSTLEDTALEILLSGVDPDGDALAYQIVQSPKHGHLIGQGAQQRYTPNPNYSGSDQFEFLVSDGVLTHTAIIQISVSPVNDAPTAQPQQIETAEDTAKQIVLFGADVDQDELTFSIKTQPSHGTLTLIGSQVTYIPSDNYSGQDQFVYLVSDGELSQDATVDVYIKPVNDTPVANNQTFETPEDLQITIIPDVSDVDNSNLTYSILAPPKNGDIRIVGSEFVYTPKENYFGEDSFSYQVGDVESTASADVALVVTPVNDAPKAAMNQPMISNGYLSTSSLSTDVDRLDDIIKTEWLMNGQLIYEGISLNHSIVLPYYASDLTIRVTDRAGLSDEMTIRTMTMCKSDQTRIGEQCIDAGQIELDQSKIEVNESAIATVETNYPDASYIEWVIDGVSRGVQAIEKSIDLVISFSVEGVKNIIAIIFDGSLQELEILQTSILVEENTKLTIVSEPVRYVKEGASYLYDVEGHSTRQGDVLKYELLSSHSGIQINADSGMITWTAADRFMQPNTADILCNEPNRIDVAIQPKLKWEWKGNSIYPQYNYTSQTPVVAPVLDTNQDGKINQYDRSAVILVTHSGNAHSAGILNVIDGQTGQEIWTTASNLSLNLAPEVHPAVGDLDQDGLIEIVVGTINGGLVVFEHDGAIKFNQPTGTSIDTVHGTIAIADLNGDGQIQIIRNANIYSATGVLLDTRSDHWSHFTISDLDGDGRQEIIDPSGVYNWNTKKRVGSFSGSSDFAVADFNKDGEPEILTDKGLYDKKGVKIWSYESNLTLTSLPVISDFNGDGFPDIGAQSGSQFMVFNHLGKKIWGQPVRPDSVPHGGAILDFNNDGWLEIVYRDLDNLYIFDARSGAIVSKLDYKNTSSSWIEASFPVVADIDKNQNADIILARYGAKDSGLVAFEDAVQPWSNTRSLWSQHSYSISHILDHGEIPQSFLPNWKTHNSFRANRAYGEADLGLVDVSMDSHSISAFLFNRGESSVDKTIKVNFFDETGQLLGHVSTQGIYELSRKKIVLDNIDTSTLKGKITASIEPIADLKECSTINNQIDIPIIEVEVRNSTQQTAKQKYLLNVEYALNQPPIFDELNTFHFSINKNELFRLPLVAQDEDQGDQLEYRLVSGPLRLAVNKRTGVLLWTPLQGQEGVHHIVVEVEDVDGAKAQIEFDITVLNRAPTATNYDIPVNEDVKSLVDLRAVDLDADSLTYTILSQPRYGVLSKNPSGKWEYLANTNYFGTDSFAFKASDGFLETQEITVTLNINPVNDAPVVTPFTVKTGIDPVSFSLSQDENGVIRGSDIEGSILTYHTSSISGGTIVRNGDMITFTPSAGFDGLGSVYYYAKDAEGLSGSPVKITVNVERINDTPIATAKSYLINEDGFQSITLSATDEESTDLEYRIVVPPRFGSLVGSGTGYVYTPNPNFHGVDSFTYEASDGNTAGQAEMTISVVSVNDAPITQDQEIITDEDNPISILLTGTDIDGDSLVYELTSLGSYGILTGSLPQFVYTPKPDVYGQDTIRFRVYDGKTYTHGQIKVTIRSVNDAPKAQPVTLTLPEDSTGSYSLQATDPEGSTLTYRIVRQPQHGVVTHSGTGRSGSYKPILNFFGADSFEYEVSDGLLTSTEIVTVNVQPVDDAPTAQNSLQDVRKNAASLINLIGTDVDGDPLTYTIIQQPINGSLMINGSQPTYTPVNNYEGTDTLKFEVSDGRRKASATVTITVKTMPNRAPIWQSIAPSSAEVNVPYTYQLKAYDPDTGPISYQLTANALVGMSISGNQFNWSPAVGQEGNQTFIIEAVDSEGGVTPQVITVQVREARLAPQISSQPITSGFAGKTYRYQVVATDQNTTDVLRYSLENAPKGMQINADSGEIVWYATSEGNYTNIKVKVSDGYWVVTQTFNLLMQKAAPLSAIIVVPGVVDQNEPFEVSIQLLGASSDARVELLLDGTPVTLNAALKATISTNQLGEHQLQVRVYDGQESTYATVVYLVRDLSDTTAPVVTFNQPENPRFITKPTSIMGQISDDTAVSWQISLYDSYDPESSANPSPIQQTTGQGTRSGSLIDIDPTLLENGVYVLLIKVTDAGGNVTTVAQNMIIDGQMKIGELAFTLEDAVVAMPGMDISIQRSYDSRQTKKVGDFGHGWTLGIQQIKMRQSRPIHTGWETYMKQILLQTSGTQLGTICLRPVQNRPVPTITVTMPNGDVETFEPEFGCSSGMRDRTTGEVIQGNSFPVSFKAVGDTLSQFAVEGQSTVSLINGRWTYSSSQDIDDNGNVGYSWYIPMQFSVTSQDGIRYDFHKTMGVQKVTEPTGHMLTVSSTGVSHSLGKKISYTRDAFNRIKNITLPNGYAWTYTYDARGDLNKVLSPDGTENKYEYDINHRLLKITDAYGVVLAGYEYDEQGRLIAMVDAKGARISLTHNLAANTEQVTNQNGHTSTYTYDDYGNVTQEVDPLGNMTLRTYNNTYDQLSETDALGRTTRWTYDDKHNKLTETNALGQTTSYTYDQRGMLLTETDHLGRVVNQSSYDNLGQLTSIQDVLGQITAIAYGSAGLTSLTDTLGNVTSYSYSSGNLTRMVDATGQTYDYSYNVSNQKVMEKVSYQSGTSVFTYNNSWSYDTKGRVTSETINGVTSSKTYGTADEVLTHTVAGDVTRYVYDANKKLIQTTYPDGSLSRSNYDAAGNLMSSTDPLGRVTTYGYDALNRQISITHPDGTITRTEYDAVGNAIAEIDAQGYRTVSEYDVLNRRIKVTNALGQSTQYSYDSLGRMVTETDALGRVTTHEYDALNRRTATTFADGSQVRTVYDALGRKTADIDPLGQRTEYQYDASSRLTQVKNALGHITQYAYNQAGHKTSQTDALGRVTKWVYTSYGAVSHHTLPNSRSRSHNYDSKNRLSEMYDFNGQRTVYRYDSNDRLIARQYHSNSGQTIQHYDAAGQLIRDELVDQQGNAQVTNYRYDAMGRLVEELKPSGDRLNYVYDHNGNKTQLTHTPVNGQAVVTQYTYDALNRLTSVTDAQGSTTYGYNAVGNRISEQQPNGISTAYAYNLKNQLTHIAHYRQGDLINEYHYTLDAAGQRLGLEEVLLINGQTQRKVTTWQYDLIGRLIDEQIRDNNVLVTHNQYQHDAVGNVTQKTSNGIITTYQYDVNDRLTSESKAGQVTTYSYDQQGNTLSETRAGQAKSYVYNSQNQLISATINGQQHQFGYDSKGIRQRKSSNGQVTAYVVDHTQAYAQVVAEYANNGVTRYTYGDDLIRQQRSSGNATQSHSYLYDGLGSTKALADATGTITDSYAYDAYGEIIASSGSTTNSYKYAGEQYDTDLGMYYNRARYYNQSIGRFSQMDSWQGRNATPITLNKYLYANASPTMYTDPSGYMSLGSVGASMSGFATLSSISYRIVSIGQSVLGPLTSMMKATTSATSATSASSIGIASIVTATVVYCNDKTKNCKPKIPILFYGKPHNELTSHIQDAQAGFGSNGIPLPFILNYYPTGHSRSFLDKYKKSGQICDKKGRPNDCDEYPFSKSVQGGKINFSNKFVSLRSINSGDNQSGGGLFGNMISADGTGSGDSFMVLAYSGSPKSGYITKKGDVKIQ